MERCEKVMLEESWLQEKVTILRMTFHLVQTLKDSQTASACPTVGLIPWTIVWTVNQTAALLSFLYIKLYMLDTLCTQKAEKL